MVQVSLIMSVHRKPQRVCKRMLFHWSMVRYHRH